jgi:hypothetical protein
VITFYGQIHEQVYRQMLANKATVGRSLCTPALVVSKGAHAHQIACFNACTLYKSAFFIFLFSFSSFPGYSLKACSRARYGKGNQERKPLITLSCSFPSINTSIISAVS